MNDGSHIGHDSGVETGSTSMNSVHDHSSEISGVDTADTYNFTGDMSSEDEDKVTCEYSNTPPMMSWANSSYDNDRSNAHQNLFNGHTESTKNVNEDLLNLSTEDTYTNKYTNKCDEYSGRASSSRSVNSGKSTPKHKPMELVVSHSSQTLVLKTPSRTTSDEHDTFSPEEDLSFIHHEESAAMTPDEVMLLDEPMLLLDDHNKKFDQSLQSIVSKSSTKEEKQRHNEEIVNLESSSISSETGSWESVFPARSNLEAREMCMTFLLHEQDFCSNDNRMQRRLMKQPQNISSVHSTPAKNNACFIDASSLADESEVFGQQPVVSWQLDNQNAAGGSSTIKPTCIKTANSNPFDNNVFTVDKFQNELDISETLEPKKPRKMIKRMDSNSSVSESLSESHDVDFFGHDDINFHAQFEKCKKKRTQDADDDITDNNIQNDLQVIDDQSRRKSLDLENVASMREIDNNTHTNLYPTRNDRQSTSSETNNDSVFSDVQRELNTTFTAAPDDAAQSSDNDETPIRSENIPENKKYISEMIVLPDTPHNSIIEIYAGSDQESIKSNCDALDSSMRLHKYSEASPIISGGASVEDFAPKIRASPMVRRKIESAPILSGGGSYVQPEEEITQPVRARPDRIPNAAWVVDMSDCSSTSSLDSRVNRDNDNNKDGTSSRKSSMGFFVDFSDDARKNLSKSASSSSHSPPTTSSFTKSDNSCEEERNRKDRNNGDEKRSLGFYVDFSADNDAAIKDSGKAEEEPVVAQKNIFSMFIDFGQKTVKSIPDRLANSMHNNQRTRARSAAPDVNASSPDKTNSRSLKMAAKSTEQNDVAAPKIETSTMKIVKNPQKHIRDDVSKVPDDTDVAKCNDTPETNGHLIFIPVETSGVNIRDKLVTNKESLKRHSWNTTGDNTQTITRHNKQRAMSVSENTASVLQPLVAGQENQTPSNRIGSTFSIDSSLSDFSKSGISSGSSSAGHARASDLNRKHRKDCKINETFDKSSSPGSQTEGILTDSSPNTDDDVTYQNENEEVENSNMKTNIVVKDLDRTKIVVETETNHENIPSGDDKIKMNIGYTLNIEDDDMKTSKKCDDENAKNTVAYTMETLQAKIERQKQLLATVTETSEDSVATNATVVTNALTDSGKFVKLSDLDKPVMPPRLDLLHDKVMSNSTGSNRIYKLFAHNSENRSYMSRSIGNNCMTNLVTSEENSRSLSRLFPHLSKGFSSSLPNGVNANIYTNRSPLELDDFTSDISVTSSLSSSMGKSAIDSTDDSLSKQPRRLGEDLLRMFLEEISPDVQIDVGGRRMRAHKCILRSRCQYFAAILAGGWVESAGNVIVMEGFSYGAVHFAMCHIYSGATTPPEGISLQELASLADLLGLEGLKEVTAHALKATYCHMFHKPCAECISGVCQVLPIALTYGLDELYRRSMRWICRHFLKVWPTRPFALLTSDIMDRARHQIIAHLNIENVLGTVLDCEQLLATLPGSRWACAVEVLTLSLLEKAHIYIAEHYSSLLASNSFLSLGRDMCWNISRLQTTLSEAASNLTPDQACRSYQRITRLSVVVHRKSSADKHAMVAVVGGPVDEAMRQDEIEWHPDFIRLVEHLSTLVETCLVKQGARAMRVNAWTRLEPQLRRRIQELACLGVGVPPFMSSASYSSGERRSRNSVRSASSSRSQDLKQIRQVIHAHNTRASSQENHTNKQPLVNNETVNKSLAHNIANIKDKSTNAVDRQQPQHHVTAKNVTEHITRNSSNKNIPAGGLRRLFDNKKDTKPTSGNTRNVAAKTMAAANVKKSHSNKIILEFVDTKDKLVAKDLINAKSSPVVKTKLNNATLASNRQRSKSEGVGKQLALTTTTTNNKSPEESSVRLKTLSARVAHAKPRYLEPRKRDLEPALVAGTTKRNINAKNKLISSTETSRTPSPCAGHRTIQNNKSTRKGGESSNMSLDSLASHKIKSGLKNANEMDMSTDSLVGSMHTSTQTVNTGIADDSSSASCDNKIKEKHLFGSQSNKSSPNLTNYTDRRKTLNLSSQQNNRMKTISTSTTRSSISSVSPKSHQSTNQTPPQRTNFKALSRTLTSPTKSSAAKMVAVKKSKRQNGGGDVSKKAQKHDEDRSEEKTKAAEVVVIIPQMERSGTFVKELASQ